MTDNSSHSVPAAGSASPPSLSNTARGRRLDTLRRSATRSDSAGSAPSAAGLRILVVEDDALLQMLMGETLTAMGHEVCALAATETEAVEAASRSHPDLMIVDWHLRPGSGLAAVRTILGIRAIPYIFVSGDVLAADQLSPGAVVLQKPYQEPDLARAIARAMSRSAN